MKPAALFLILPVAAALLACGLGGLAMSVRYTEMRKSPERYEALVKAAEGMGWKSKLGQSSSDWELEVYPVDGQVIMFTSHINDQTIGFTCTGGELEDRDTCTAAANKLFKAGWGEEYSSFHL